VWAKVADIVEYDRIVLVHGKAAGDGGEAKVLVDNLSTDFKMTTSSEPGGGPSPHHAPSNGSSGGSFYISEDRPIEEDDPFPPDWGDPELPSAEVPPEDHGLPDGDDPQAILEPVEEIPLVAAVMSEVGMGVAIELQEIFQEDQEAIMQAPVSPEVPVEGLLSVGQEALSGEPEEELPPFILPPTASPGRETNYMVTLILRPSSDKARDVLRIRRLHGTIISYPGNDRFAFHVFERGKGYLMEFPNETTGACPELVARLQGMVGADNVRIDPITYL
jgi:hypothetical protein